MSHQADYSDLLRSKTSVKWQSIGTGRRSGVAVPLFSIHSKNSVGIGEIPDLNMLIDWCADNSISILQLLPLNDVGNDFAPYNSQSTFAIEPSYISIKKLRKADLKPYRKELRELKKNFLKNSGRVNYGIKKEKLTLLRKIFDSTDVDSIESYNKYVEKNLHWLKFYAIFKVLTTMHSGKSWTDWELKYRYISSLNSEKIYRNNLSEIKFIYWIQWQLFEQLCSVKKYARRKKVYLMGDLPFLVARNSADVWAYKNYFKIHLSSGAPPDMYFSRGQRWGMPPYNWENIAADEFSYIKERLKYAENFYDMFRIDHFVGLFRVWTIDMKAPEELQGSSGRFDPEDERLWEDHGRTILNEMNNATVMLPCAEDLGTVPECSDKVLKEFGVTGINVQRWEKKWNGRFEFIDPENYRTNSVATVSTHDSSTLPAWYKYECGTVDEFAFRMACEKLNIRDNRYSELKEILFESAGTGEHRLEWRKDISNVYMLLNILKVNFEEAKEIVEMYLSAYGEKDVFRNYTGASGNELTTELIKKNLLKIGSADSIFSIQLLAEYLYLDKNILENYSGRYQRINTPGTVDGSNWSITLPVSLEELMKLEINEMIKQINIQSGRC